MIMNLIIAFALMSMGLVTGLLFAFSNFVLQSLADLPDDKGMFAMQRINERIINPLFLLLFNVPLNNKLAAADLSAASEIWPAYRRQWQVWNHRRTFVGVVAIVLLATGLGSSS